MASTIIKKEKCWDLISVVTCSTCTWPRWLLYSFRCSCSVFFFFFWPFPLAVSSAVPVRFQCGSSAGNGPRNVDVEHRQIESLVKMDKSGQVWTGLAMRWIIKFDVIGLNFLIALTFQWISINNFWFWIVCSC